MRDGRGRSGPAHLVCRRQCRRGPASATLQYMAFLTGEFPRAIPRATWLASRARNVVHRPVFIGSVGVGTFIAAAVALILAPQQVRHVGQTPPASLAVRPDTAPLIAALSQ